MVEAVLERQERQSLPGGGLIVLKSCGSESAACVKGLLVGGLEHVTNSSFSEGLKPPTRLCERVDEGARKKSCVRKCCMWKGCV